jgi:succinate dehydrogenase / fumarate reductase cytochrome b subunit
MSNMSAKKQRPVWYNLSPVNLPAPGLVSIFHRVSGILLFLGLIWFLYLLDLSLTSQSGYAKFAEYIGHPLMKLALLVMLWSYLHHFCAGIRFLLLDIHVGGTLPAARTSSFIVFGASVALTVILGIKLW